MCAAVFNVARAPAGDNLYILSNSVTPNVSASVNIRMLSRPQEYNIYMNTPVWIYDSYWINCI